jgi:hypothetical protein
MSVYLVYQSVCVSIHTSPSGGREEGGEWGGQAILQTGILIDKLMEFPEVSDFQPAMIDRCQSAVEVVWELD